jgi:hypothetical protein
VSIVRFGNYVPKQVREWDRIFADLNQVIAVTSDGVTINADNLPAPDAAYVTLSNNASLTNDRVLLPIVGETTITDHGAGFSVTVGLADYGTPGTYTKVVVDRKGRVVTGDQLLTEDMPNPLQNIISGNGNPNGVLSAPTGSLYLNVSGGTGTTLYVKESGSSNTGWIGK